MGDEGFRYTVSEDEAVEENEPTERQRRAVGETAGSGEEPEGAIPGPGIGAAFLTYAFILGIRVSGLSSLFRQPNPRNPLAAPPLRGIGEFVFYDWIFLAVIGLVSSGVLLAMAAGGSGEAASERVKLLAATGVGLPALGYIVGSLVIVLT